MQPLDGFLIDRLGCHALADAGLAEHEVETRYPRLIHVSVTTFGSIGPRARWRGSELVASATAGTLRSTGDPDRAPVKEALDACTFHADMAAAAGALAALHERGVSGRGQHVDVSVQEVAFSRGVSGVLAWQFDRRRLGRAEARLRARAGAGRRSTLARGRDLRDPALQGARRGA